MGNRLIHKFSYPVAALKALPKEQLSAFLLLGLLLNEANWLQKLLLVSTLDQSGNEAEDKARLALSLMLSKMLGAKIHEGWCRMQGNPIKVTLDVLRKTTRAKKFNEKLESMLAPGSLIYSVRNLHAFHYPTQLSLDGLPSIAPADVAIYATEYSGDTLSMLSELCATAEMISITGKDTIDAALKFILDEIVEAARIYTEMLSELLHSFVVDVLKTSATDELINNDDAPSLDAIRLRFFAAPPEI